MAKKINEISNTPQVGTTLKSWFYPITLQRLIISMVDFEAVKTPININTSGVIQPLSAEELKIKPEEQRSWEWLQVHCESNLQLTPEGPGVIGDKVIYDGIRYRCLKRKNFKLYGYIEYHLVQDYEGDD